MLKEGNIMQDFLTIVQSLGFPIACVIALFVMLQNEQKAHKEETAKLTETLTELKISFSESIHAQETTVTEAINNNTLVMQRLLDKIDKDG